MRQMMLDVVEFAAEVLTSETFSQADRELSPRRRRFRKPIKHKGDVGSHRYQIGDLAQRLARLS